MLLCRLEKQEIAWFQDCFKALHVSAICGVPTLSFLQLELTVAHYNFGGLMS